MSFFSPIPSKPNAMVYFNQTQDKMSLDISKNDSSEKENRISNLAKTQLATTPVKLQPAKRFRSQSSENYSASPSKKMRSDFDSTSESNGISQLECLMYSTVQSMQISFKMNAKLLNSTGQQKEKEKFLKKYIILISNGTINPQIFLPSINKISTSTALTSDCFKINATQFASKPANQSQIAELLEKAIKPSIANSPSIEEFESVKVKNSLKLEWEEKTKLLFKSKKFQVLSSSEREKQLHLMAKENWIDQCLESYNQMKQDQERELNELKYHDYIDYENKFIEASVACLEDKDECAPTQIVFDVSEDENELICRNEKHEQYINSMEYEYHLDFEKKALQATLEEHSFAELDDVAVPKIFCDDISEDEEALIDQSIEQRQFFDSIEDEYQLYSEKNALLAKETLLKDFIEFISKGMLDASHYESLISSIAKENLDFSQFLTDFAKNFIFIPARHEDILNLLNSILDEKSHQAHIDFMMNQYHFNSSRH